MFNERQLLCLSTLLEAILEIPDRNVRELMLLAFSDALDANNMFCKYETAWHKVSVFFGLHAYHPIERPTENNVWGTAFGRGTFVKCFEKVRRGKAYGQRPYERIDGARHSARGERAEGILVEDFAALQQTPRGHPATMPVLRRPVLHPGPFGGRPSSPTRRTLTTSSTPNCPTSSTSGSGWG
jgi:hypothetical protein